MDGWTDGVITQSSDKLRESQFARDWIDRNSRDFHTHNNSNKTNKFSIVVVVVVVYSWKNAQGGGPISQPNDQLSSAVLQFLLLCRTSASHRRLKRHASTTTAALLYIPSSTTSWAYILILRACVSVWWMESWSRSQCIDRPLRRVAIHPLVSRPRVPWRDNSSSSSGDTSFTAVLARRLVSIFLIGPFFIVNWWWIRQCSYAVSSCDGDARSNNNNTHTHTKVYIYIYKMLMEKCNSTDNGGKRKKKKVESQHNTKSSYSSAQLSSRKQTSNTIDPLFPCSNTLCM